MCRREDLNLYGLPHTLLKRTRIPIPPLRPLRPELIFDLLHGSPTATFFRVISLSISLRLLLYYNYTTMDDPLKLILKKLAEIDNRLKKLETSKRITSEVKSQTAADKTASSVSQHDPLFAKAVEIMEKYDEISASTLQQALKIDKARAEKLLDELEAAGYGTCYWKEV